MTVQGQLLDMLETVADAPRLIDEFIPGFAAMVDDIVVGCEDAI